MFGRVGSIGGGILALLVLLAGIGNVYLKKSRANEEYRKEAHALIEKCDCYKTNKDYCDWLVEVSHDEAFDHSYKVSYAPRGRLRMQDASTFDEDAYASELFDVMIRHAKEDKADVVVKSLEKMLKDLEGEQDTSSKPPTK